VLRRNVGSQGVYLQAINTAVTPNAGKTGDAANITGAWSADGGAEHAGYATTHPVEIGGGCYWQPLSQAETDGNSLNYRWASSTANVTIAPLRETTASIVADSLLGRSVDAGADGGHTVSQALQYLRNNWSIVGTTLTVYMTDGTTTSWTLDVSADASLATTMDAIKAKTDVLPTGVQVADAMLSRSVDGGGNGPRTVAQALQLMRNRWEIVGSTLSVYQSNDSTPSWTSAVTLANGVVTASDPS
jgi:hypothetical protein